MKYEQIVINTVDDLPKKEGIYIAKHKTKDYVNTHLYKGEDYNELWYRTIEWYLQPLAELKEEEPKQSAEEIKFAELSENLFNLAALDNGWLECSLSPQDCITLLDWFKVNVLTKYRQQGIPTEEEISIEAYDEDMPMEGDQHTFKYAFDDDQAEAFISGAKWAVNKWKGE